jgi:hypothetical protein
MAGCKLIHKGVYGKNSDQKYDNWLGEFSPGKLDGKII